jgi:hypothetical protein
MSTKYVPTGRPRGRPPGIKNLHHPAAHPSVEPAGMRMDDAARFVGVSPSMMKKLVAKGTVRSVTIGNARIVLVDSLRQLLATT